MTTTPKPFKREEAGRNGPNWGASAHTEIDLIADPTGNIIYAEGTVTCRRNKQIVSTQTIDNRCIFVVDGKPKFRVNAKVWRQEDSKACLWHVLTQLIQIGSQNS
jgi:hypothetical protein